MVRVEGLSIGYRVQGGSIEALAEADLEFPRGQISALVGPSGCGKTSLIQVLAGLRRPSAGRVLIDGEELRGLRPRTAVIFQDYGLLPWKTVEENAELALLLRGIPGAERRRLVDPILAELGLGGFKRFYPNRLSGGMKQRLAIARALAAEPDLLLMDEPFSSLDALTREALQETLLEIRERHGMTVVIVTHSIEEAVYLADRVYVLAGTLPGRIRGCFDLRKEDPDLSAVVAPSPEPHTAPLPGEDVGKRGFRSSPRFHAFTAEIRNRLREEGAVSGTLPKKTMARSARGARALALRMAMGLGALLLMFLLWAWGSRALGKPFLPPPSKALARLVERLADGSLLRHVLASARRIGIAILLTAPPTAALGLAAGRSRRLDFILSPLIYLFYPLPKIAFLPIVMLLLGLGDASKVGIIVLIVASQVLVNARDAARGIAEGYFDSARSLGAGRASVFRHVLLPASLPSLLSALRVSLGTSTAVLFFAETFATEEGLGWYIMDAWARVDYPDMFAAIVALSLFGILCFALVDLAEAFFCRWRKKD